MQRFKWRLQRLLDVRQKQEDALRAELMALTEQMTALRGRMLMEKAMLRSRLAELGRLDGTTRLSGQQIFMTHVAVIDQRIAALRRELDKLESKRNEKTEAIMAARKSRKALERLREQAWQSYCRAQHTQQQRDEDETTNAAVARTLLGYR